MFWIRYRYCTKGSRSDWMYVDLGRGAATWSDAEIDEYVQEELRHDPEGIRRSDWERVDCPPVEVLAKRVASLRSDIEYKTRLAQQYEMALAFVANNRVYDEDSLESAYWQRRVRENRR